MLKRLFIASAVLPFAAMAAIAQDIPAEQKACLDNAFALAQAAAGKSLADDALAALDAKIGALEEMCDAKNYDGASTAAKEIESTISGS